MWLAKTKIGIVRVFLNKPIRWAVNPLAADSIGKNMWVDTSGWNNGTAYGLPLNVPAENIKSEWEDCISWEDEPIEVELTKVDRHFIQCDKCGKAFSYLNKDIETIEISTQPSSPYTDEFEIVHCPHCKSEVYL